MTHPAGTIPAIDVTEAAARLHDNRGDLPADAAPVLVDVREPNELVDARVAGAAHFPMSTFALRFNELPKDRPILVMCASGGRSAAVTAFLMRNGWTDVLNVDGGITAWRRAGLPVRHGPVEPGEGGL
ncbi:MAG TPA: rhodanese-like domain-containing protein [Candidatus Limnocylindrales bacterium]|nr:rhodanese-like domain-containing protein [Candidatus Limnocylindrales bacterium]